MDWGEHCTGWSPPLFDREETYNGLHMYTFFPFPVLKITSAIFQWIPNPAKLEMVDIQRLCVLTADRGHYSLFKSGIYWKYRY